MEFTQHQNEVLAYNRRDFLKSGSFATLMTMLGGVELLAQNTPAPADANKPAPPKVKLAVIGLGTWGREIVNTLGRLPQADLVAICDNYPASLKRTANAAPNAKQTEDCRALLTDKEIKAVIIATASHQHKEIVLEALKAGKHVYCEAPLANTLEDVRAIAQAAQAAPHLLFQAGLQLRSDPQRHFLLPFIRSGALGRNLMARAQWHKKQSWRATSPNPEREKALNWRLNKEISPGLAGEIGVHAIDQAGWYLNARPVSVTGFGTIAFWNDGRDVPDTVQAMVEYPGGIYLCYDCTLGNSFDADYEIYYGSDAAVMLRESKAWMFKEVDAPLLGWEVYAAKQTFYRETGIALVAGASKSVPTSDKPAESTEPAKTPLYFALDAFLRNSADLTAAEEDFVNSYGADDQAALKEHLAKTPRRPSAGYLEGYQAAVTALKANEAILTGKRIALDPAWYKLA